jgi:hypothetical protein
VRALFGVHRRPSYRRVAERRPGVSTGAGLAQAATLRETWQERG